MVTYQSARDGILSIFYLANADLNPSVSHRYSLHPQAVLPLAPHITAAAPVHCDQLCDQRQVGIRSLSWESCLYGRIDANHSLAVQSV